MERMVNQRLVWFLESTGFFSSAQCGFRRNRCTTDHLVSLDTAVRQSFASKQHTFTVLFDIEKAYGTAWRHAILLKLRSAGIQGNMGYFLANFIKDRTFRVKVGMSLSDSFVQESGVPQGSVLSVTLFGVLINDICESLPPTVHRSLFVDDFAIWVSTSSSVSAQRQLQLCIDGLTKWSLLNGLKFSTGKTVCVHFCRRTVCYKSIAHSALGAWPAGPYSLRAPGWGRPGQEGQPRSRWNRVTAARRGGQAVSAGKGRWRLQSICSSGHVLVKLV